MRPSLFIRQGKLIERDVSMFPMYQEADEEFLTFIGQFYSKNNHFLPKEILVPDSVDRDMITELLETAVHQPKKGPKKSCFCLRTKMRKLPCGKNSR